MNHDTQLLSVELATIEKWFCGEDNIDIIEKYPFLFTDKHVNQSLIFA